MSIELESLRRANFDWAMRLSEVWEDSAHDVPDLHSALREQLRDQVQVMRSQGRSDSPLGWVLVGAGGSGKTHLLGSFRREVEREQCNFVLVDMTDVRDFWQTVLQGYLGSLQQRIRGGDFQYLGVLRNIIDKLGPNKPAARILGMLAEHKSTHLKADIDKVLNALGQGHRAETLKYQDVVRALICLNSENFALANLGMTWLQGQPIETQDKAAFGFVTNREEPRKIVEALSWFMSLSGPTVLAFDQLDSIVTQLHFRQLGKDMPDEEARANAIILEIGGGLGALRDTARNTLTVVSCVESTWEILSKTVLRTYVDRFRPAQRLDAVGDASIARAIVAGRLAAGYALAGFDPPHATWPFHAQAFGESDDEQPSRGVEKVRGISPTLPDSGVCQRSRVVWVEPIFQATAARIRSVPAARCAVRSLPSRDRHRILARAQVRGSASGSFASECFGVPDSRSRDFPARSPRSSIPCLPEARPPGPYMPGCGSSFTTRASGKSTIACARSNKHMQTLTSHASRRR